MIKYEKAILQVYCIFSLEKYTLVNILLFPVSSEYMYVGNKDLLQLMIQVIGY